MKIKLSDFEKEVLIESFLYLNSKMDYDEEKELVEKANISISDIAELRQKIERHYNK
jgi:hypothetical protein